MFLPTLPSHHHHHHRHDASARGVGLRLCVAVRGIRVAVVVVGAETTKPSQGRWSVGTKEVGSDVARIGPGGLHTWVQSHASQSTCHCHIQPRRVRSRGRMCCRSDSKRKKCHCGALATCTTTPCVQVVDVDPRWDVGHLALVAAFQGGGVASFAGVLLAQAHASTLVLSPVSQTAPLPQGSRTIRRSPHPSSGSTRLFLHLVLACFRSRTHAVGLVPRVHGYHGSTGSSGSQVRPCGYNSPTSDRPALHSQCGVADLFVYPDQCCSGVEFTIPFLYDTRDHAMHHALYNINYAFPFIWMDSIHGTYQKPLSNKDQRLKD